MRRRLHPVGRCLYQLWAEAAQRTTWRSALRCNESPVMAKTTMVGQAEGQMEE